MTLRLPTRHCATAAMLAAGYVAQHNQVQLHPHQRARARWCVIDSRLAAAGLAVHHDGDVEARQRGVDELRDAAHAHDVHLRGMFCPRSRLCLRVCMRVAASLCSRSTGWQCKQAFDQCRTSIFNPCHASSRLARQRRGHFNHDLQQCGCPCLPAWPQAPGTRGS